MPYDDDDEELDSVDNREREFTCPSCNTTFKMKMRDIRGQKTIKCINTDCNKEISLIVKSIEKSQFDRAMDQLDKSLDSLGDFKMDL